MVVGRNHTSIQGNLAVLLSVACLLSFECYSQKITHVDFEVVGSSVKIVYDIDDCSGDKTYDLRVLLGKDGALTEIKRGLSGDIEDVACGPSKKITWDVLADREELTGRIYFALEVYRTHAVVVTEAGNPNDKKPWSHRSWKADKGWIGGSIGVFTPYETYSHVPRNMTQGGTFFNASIGYLPTLLLGVSTTAFTYSSAKKNQFDVASWKNWGVMIGPLISLPIGNVIKWELRPQVGYSEITEASDMSQPGSLDVVRAGVACNLGMGLRLNIGKRTCYMLNVDYLSAPIRFDDYPIETDPGTVGASFGIAFRFY